MPPLLCHDIFISIYQVMIVLTKGTLSLRLNLQKLPASDVSTYKMKLTSEATEQSKELTLQSTSFDDRSLAATLTVNEGAENLAGGVVSLTDPSYPAGFYLCEVTGSNGGAYVEYLRCYAYLERVAGEEGYREFDDYTETRTYYSYEQ